MKIKIEQFFKSNKDLGIFLLRLFISFRIIYGVLDNILSWTKMLEFSKFLETNQFPLPTLSAHISVYIQFFAALFILIGYKTRIAAFALVVHFLIALIFYHLKVRDSVEGMTPALAMLFGSLTLLFNGPGSLSIKHTKTSKYI